MAVVNTTLYGDLAVLPIPAKSEATEKIEWKTEVQENKRGGEFRVSLRPAPRREYSYTLVFSSLADHARVLNTLRASRASRWAVPVWTEAQFVGAITLNSASVSAEVDIYTFRGPGLAFIYESRTKWQVVEVSSVGTGVLNLDTLTDEYDNAWIMPCRTGYLKSNPNRETSGVSGDTDLTFAIEDALNEIDAEITATPSIIYVDDGNSEEVDVYTDPWLMSGKRIQDSVVQKIDIVDETIGAFEYKTFWNGPSLSRQVKFVMDGHAELKSFRDFIYRRRGKYTSFFSPLLMSDMRVTSTGMITYDFDMEHDDYALPASDLGYIAFCMKDGTWKWRRIDGVSAPSGGVVTVYLTDTLDELAEDILFVSFMPRWRLDADSISIKYHSNGTSECSVKIKELFTVEIELSSGAPE